MNRPNRAQLETARRLLAHEGAAAGSTHTSVEAATTAARVYDKLHRHMAPLVGVAGVQLLFVRSAKLAQGEFPGLAEVSVSDGSSQLRACLQAQDPAIAMESAAALFATFFALIITFIGERLTTQILRSAWPTIEALAGAQAPTENQK